MNKPTKLQKKAAEIIHSALSEIKTEHWNLSSEVKKVYTALSALRSPLTYMSDPPTKEVWEKLKGDLGNLHVAIGQISLNNDRVDEAEEWFAALTESVNEKGDK